jgi:hypothetical protein
MGNMVEDIKVELQAFHQWPISFVKREGNMWLIYSPNMLLRMWRLFLGINHLLIVFVMLRGVKRASRARA